MANKQSFVTLLNNAHMLISVKMMRYRYLGNFKKKRAAKSSRVLKETQ